MSKLFQIYEEELADLERIVPLLAIRLSDQLSPADLVKLRRVKNILSDVRWTHGPWKSERVDDDDPDLEL